MKKAQNLAMYVLLLSGVALAVISMQTYLRRSVQARVKDLSDTLIAAEEDHLTSWDSNYMTASSKNSQTESASKQEVLAGGGKRYDISTTMSASQYVETEDPTKSINRGGNTASGGGSNIPFSESGNY